MKRPHVTIMSSCSLDGRTSPKPHTSSRVFVPLTPKVFTKRRMDLRKKVDAIMVGSETVLIDDPRLIRPNQNPKTIRIIVDSRGRVKPRHRVLSDRFYTVMLVSRKTPRSYKKMVSSIKNKDIIESGSDKVDLPKAMQKLYKMGVRSILVEGGGTLVYQLLANKLVDEMKIVYLPYFIGAKRSASLVSGTDSIFGRARLRVKRQGVKDNFVYVEGTLDYS